MPPKVPKDVKVWNPDLIRAAQSRYHKAETEHRRDARHWQVAVELLQAAKAPIYRQKTGENAGIVLNIPPKINHKIHQILVRVVDGTLAVVEGPAVVRGAGGEKAERPLASPLAYNHAAGGDPFTPGVSLEMTSFYRKRLYGDSCTALLAGMYVSLRPEPGFIMTKEHIMRSASRYTNHRMEFDYRSGQFGAWKGMDKLVEHNLVTRRRGIGVKHEFSLTLLGLQFCHSLFTKKIHPDFQSAEKVVQPQYAIVDAAGRVRPRGEGGNGDDGIGCGGLLATSSSETSQGFESSPIQWRQHEGYLLGMDDESSVLDMQHTPRGAFWPQSAAAASPPSADMVRALRCSMLEKSSAKCARERVGDEDSELMQALKMSEQEAATSMRSHRKETDFAENKDDASVEGEMERVLELSLLEAQGDASAAMQLSGSSDEDLDMARAMSLSDNQDDINIDIDIDDDTASTEQLQFEEVLRQSMLESGSPSARKWRGEAVPSISVRQKRKHAGADAGPVLAGRCSSPSSSSHCAVQEYAVKKKRVAGTGGFPPMPSPVVVVLDLVEREAEKEEKGHRTHVVYPCVDLTQICAPATGSSSSSSSCSKKHVKVTPIKDSVCYATTPFTANFDLTNDEDAIDLISEESGGYGEDSVEVTSPPLHLNPADFETWSIPIIRSGDMSTGCASSDETTDEEFSLQVDNFERVNQKTYRQFYERIYDIMQELNPSCSTNQSRLTVGDFHTTVMYKDCTYSLDFIVERKTISDIVSRSNDTKSTAWLAGPHFKQATALQHCGMSHAFLLIEGDACKVEGVHHALVDYVGQVSADMITTSQDLVTFFAQMIAREWSSRRIRLLQSWHANSTAMMLVCMSYFARVRYQAWRRQGNSAITENLLWGKFPSLKSFRKDLITAKTIKTLYQDLRQDGIHLEMCARVARRFGSWKVLQEAYAQCTSEAHALLLLAGLSTSSVKPTVVDGVFRGPDDAQQGEHSEIEPFDASCQMRQSQRVFILMSGKFPNKVRHLTLSPRLELGAGEATVTKSSTVEVSKSFEGIFQDSETSIPRPPGVAVVHASVAVNLDEAEEGAGSQSSALPELFPWVSVVTKCRCQSLKLARSGRRHRLVVVPGDAMLTALVRAREALGPPPATPQPRTGQLLEDDPIVPNAALLPYCHALVHAAVSTWMFPPHALPGGWIIGSRQQDAIASAFSSCPTPQVQTRYQVILEDLSSPVSSHAASGRLARAVSLIDGDRAEGGRCSQHPVTLQLKKFGEHLPVTACKDISVIFPKLLPMLILYFNSECDNCTVIQTKNRKETSNWIETFCKACHDESLMI